MADIIADKLARLETGHEKLKGVVLGNGTEGHEQRIGQLEERCQPDNCIGVKALEKHIKELKEMQESRRQFRIGDLANLIQVVMLAVLIYQVVL
jgi:hypothetical protein